MGHEHAGVLRPERLRRSAGQARGAGALADLAWSGHVLIRDGEVGDPFVVLDLPAAVGGRVLYRLNGFGVPIPESSPTPPRYPMSASLRPSVRRIAAALGPTNDHP